MDSIISLHSLGILEVISVDVGVDDGCGPELVVVGAVEVVLAEAVSAFLPSVSLSFALRLLFFL